MFKIEKTIAVDFDGVIMQYESWEQDAECIKLPTPNVKEAFRMLHSLGYKIVIYTCRLSHVWGNKGFEKQYLVLSNWLKTHEIPYDEISVFSKPVADIYIDDRSIRFEGNWQKTLQQIEELMQK